MKKVLLSVLAVWILVCGSLTGLFLIFPEGKISVSADIIIVDDDGTPGVDCNFTSIQPAVNAANPGDTVFVKNGTYYESVVVNKRINLTGEDRDNTIIDATFIDDDVVRITANEVNIEGFTINGAGDIGNPGMGYAGLSLNNVQNCNIFNNKLTWNIDNGIYLSSSSNNNITYNTVTLSDQVGIYLSSSSSNLITDNIVFDHFMEGIKLESSSNNKIIGNALSDNIAGISLSSSSNNNNITGNNASNNGAAGISLGSSSFNNITGNTLSNTNFGINFWLSSNNNITTNNISLNGDCGIYLGGSSNNKMMKNNISNNNNGIKIESSSNNEIYHNNIMNNAIQAYDDSNNGNQWDDSYPSGGNYWSDYGGFDNYSGPAQDVPGSDGIGDTEYIIDPNSKDNYPLMGPIGEIGPRIQLVYPANNSVIQPGVIIDFLIYDEDIDIVNYSIDGGIEQAFPEPFDISTSGWIDGLHNVTINATDLNNHSIFRIFFFTIDSIKPVISLNSPANNSIIPNGSILNFSVVDTTLGNVNYSINGGVNITLSDPFNISTSGWLDGDYTVQINAQDEAGNSNSTWYFFTLDTASPIIILNSPGNNSIIPAGTPLNFSIIESNLAQANYSVNGGSNISLPDPFDVSTSGWADGDYTVQINAQDVAGNLTTSWFFFIIDSTKPNIKLNSPLNNSVIPNGTLLNLSVIDLHIIQVNYSINGGPDIPLSDPFNVSTSGWPDGDHTIQINAQDEAGNSNSSWYFFTLDSASPIIILNAPGNNSIIPVGTPLNFSIIESNLAQVNYSVNGGLNISLSDPFDISTSGWADGDYTVQIKALDVAGNLTISWFFFTIDSTIPSIQLNSPGNNSYIPNGTFLNFSVIDFNLDHANYSINGGADIPLSDPYDISTSGWTDGDYTVQINAVDMAGNSNSSWYFFTIDSTKPSIVLNDPLDNSIHPSGILLNFSILDSNLSHANYSINGGPDTLFLDPYDISTSGWTDGDYTILINAIDMAGNLNSSWFFFTIDSAKPTIQLISPLNNSIITAGTILNFSVLDSNQDLVNYSINGGADTPLSDPYDLSTGGWADGDYTVQINAQDMVGNTNSSWYFFTIDATSPTILLNSPGNNSIVPSGTLLDFSIDDPNISQTNYSINGGPDISFTVPFDISTGSWADGDYTITINAEDVAENKNTLLFGFTIDSTKPTIQLNSPVNNSIIPSDTILDFLVTDLHLDQVNYSVNGGADVLLSDPFDISTSSWLDGDYTVQINVMDLAGNSNSSSYFFTIDSTLPQIILNAPLNNSVIPEGTLLDFSIMDSHLFQVNYSVNGGADTLFIDPYDISTVGWSDGDYLVQINTIDSAGNLNFSWYLFTIDSTLPMFLLNSPENNSVIPNGTILDFSIIEPNLIQTNYSINGGLNVSFSAPYNISTVGWIDGDYTIQINAVDLAENSNSSWYFFTVDSSRPTIVLNNPENNSFIPNSTILNFSIIDPHLTQVNYSIDGGADIPLTDPYNISISSLPDGNYTVQINAVDLAENSNSSWYFFTIDSALPMIIFEAPENNSIVQNGTILNFSIVDTYLMQVNYSINTGADTPLSDPFDISTLGWTDGNYTIQINTMDLAGNLNSSWYFITLDSTSPAIILNTPQNNSVISNGSLLDFVIIDSNLQQVNYSINGETNISLSDPFNITTAGWTDDNYTIQINALDIVGNSASAWFFFTIDSIPPAIILNTPENNSVVQGGIILDFSIIEPNPIQANYSINGGVDNAFSDPFNIPTLDWDDGDYTIQIIAKDQAGNSNSLWFFFTIDSTPPTISIDPNLNHSIISIGEIIHLNISDPDTDTVMYSIDGGEYSAIIPPYNIGTSALSDGRHTINVTANDTLGNEALIWFEVYVITETLFSLKDEIGDVMNEAEEQVGGYPDIDMINITIWKVGDYLLYEMSVEGIIQDQMVGSNVYLYSLSLFMDETDDPENMDDSDFTITSGLGVVEIKNEATGETQSLEAFGFGTSTLRSLIPLTFINDNTDFEINANTVVYINFNLGSGTYDEAFLDTSLDATDLLFDTDNDGIPDDEDNDDDNDDYLDDEDDFPLDEEEWLDTDGDGIGNNADTDDDDDGHPDDEDDLPLDDSDWLDTDSDGMGDKLDPDDDGDGYLDAIEITEQTDPLDENSIPPDNDGDFVPDSLDPDDDNDDVLDEDDDYPFDSTKSKKSSEGGGFGLIIILIIIVIVVVLVVLLFLRKRGKGAEEAPAPEGETIAFGGMEMQGQVPTEGEGAFGLGEGVPSAMPEAATYKCPHCEKPFTAPIYQQAMIAVCPSCGKRTTIGQQ